MPKGRFYCHELCTGREGGGGAKKNIPKTGDPSGSMTIDPMKFLCQNSVRSQTFMTKIKAEVPFSSSSENKIHLLPHGVLGLSTQGPLSAHNPLINSKSRAPLFRTHEPSSTR
jgi:hypothetical protein